MNKFYNCIAECRTNEINNCLIKIEGNIYIT